MTNLSLTHSFFKMYNYTRHHHSNIWHHPSNAVTRESWQAHSNAWHAQTTRDTPIATRDTPKQRVISGVSGAGTVVGSAGAISSGGTPSRGVPVLYTASHLVRVQIRWVESEMSKLLVLITANRPIRCIAWEAWFIVPRPLLVNVQSRHLLVLTFLSMLSKGRAGHAGRLNREWETNALYS